jgi:hypothetical protein
MREQALAIQHRFHQLGKRAENQASPKSVAAPAATLNHKIALIGRAGAAT